MAELLVADKCPCGEFKEPELINVSAMGDSAPKWAIGWKCPNQFYPAHGDFVKKAQHGVQ